MGCRTGIGRTAQKWREVWAKERKKGREDREEEKEEGEQRTAVELGKGRQALTTCIPDVFTLNPWSNVKQV